MIDTYLGEEEDTESFHFLLAGLIQDKSVMTETYCHLMLSGAGWEMHRVVYSSPQCTGDHFINSFIVFETFWYSCWQYY